MTTPQQITSIINPLIEAEGYKIYQVAWRKEFGEEILEIMIQHQSNNPISVDDCVKVSNLISVILDVEAEIDKAYSLKVSSPGIDRPLLTLEHFKQFIDQQVKIKLFKTMENKRKFTATIVAVDELNQQVELAMHVKQTFKVDLDNIASAKLEVTKKLIDYIKYNNIN